MPRPSLRVSAPKHRASKSRTPRRTRRNAVLPGLAVAALAAAVVSGPALSGTSLAGADGGSDVATAALARVNDASPTFDVLATDPALLAEMDEQRGEAPSRSDRRDGVDRTKLAALTREAESGGQVTRTEEIAQVAESEPESSTAAVVSGDPRQIALAMLPEFGFSSDQFSCLDSLWTKESGWNVYADNPTSSAYGIPQALPGEKMASAGADWATNPATQIRWGLGYIRDSYGSPCSAWSHSVANNWY